MPAYPASYPSAGPATKDPNARFVYKGGVSGLTLHQLFAGVASLEQAARIGPTVSWTRNTNSYMGFNSSGVGVFAPHNLFDDSNDLDFATTNWSGTRMAAVVSGQADSDGGSNAFLLEANATNASGSRIDQTVGGAGAVDNNRIFTLEVIAKNPSTNPGTGWIRTRLQNTDGDRLDAWFDLTGSGAIGSTVVTSDAAAVSGTHTITALADSFFRCRISCQITGGTSAIAAWLTIAEADTDESCDSGDQVVFYKPLAVRGLANTYVENTGNSPKYDQPLFDHDPANSNASLGVGVFQAGTNLCLQTQDFETTWTNPGANTTYTTGKAALDGTNTATDVLHGDSDESTEQTLTVADNTVHCFSIFVHSGTTGTHDWIRVGYRDASANTNGFQFWFDLTAGTIGTSGASGTGTLTNTGVIDEGNGWYRIWGSGQIVSGQTDAEILLQNVTADGSSTSEATNSVWYWGANLTATSFLLPYIPATTASVTVDADVPTTTDVSWANASQGTFYVKGGVPVSAFSSDHFFYDLNDNSSSDRYIAFVSNTQGDVSRMNFIGTGASRLDLQDNTAWTSGGAQRKMAAAYEVGSGGAMYEDGTQSETNGTMASAGAGFSDFNIGTDLDGITHLNGHIAELKYWNVRKPNAFLDSITT